ncbi:MAG: PAS domain-containing protein, partial [Verrucomicrobiota bacterium]
MANWKQMVDSEGTWGMEYRFQTPDKQVTWVYALATPYRDEAGKIVKYVGINLDITKRKQAETKLQLAANVFTHAREGIIITDVKGTII